MGYKVNYVCIVCSTTFTRKSSAIRHSASIPGGTHLFVKLIDYIVGRMQGRYQPSSPLSYRQKKKNEKNFRNLHSLVNCNPAVSNMIPASRFTVRFDETKKDEYHRVNSAYESVELDLPKYKELATHIRKRHTEADANQILARIKGFYLEGKGNFIEIDKMLEFFRNIDMDRRI
jgi:hypothetical protein